jgi:hypothetical protein
LFYFGIKHEFKAVGYQPTNAWRARSMVLEVSVSVRWRKGGRVEEMKRGLYDLYTKNFTTLIFFNDLPTTS